MAKHEANDNFNPSTKGAKSDPKHEPKHAKPDNGGGEKKAGSK